MTVAVERADLVPRIYHTIPGYSDTVDQLARVETLLQQRRRRSPTHRWIYTEAGEQAVIDAVTDTEVVELEDAEAAVAAALTSASLADGISEAFTAAHARLKNRVEELRLTHTDHVLAGLNDALQELATEARALGNLCEIADLQTAVAADRLADHEALSQMIGDITTIRQHQATIMRNTGEHTTPSGRKTIVWHLRNLDEVFEHWQVWLIHGTFAHGREQQLRPIPAPWPTHPISDEFTLWALSAGADLWVPTQTEHDERRAELITKAQARDVRRYTGEFRDPDAVKHQSSARRIGR